jgi:hypothetical protein
MFRIAPGATRAVETIGLIGLEQGTGARQRRTAGQKLLAAAFQSPPATGST